MNHTVSRITKKLADALAARTSPWLRLHDAGFRERVDATLDPVLIVRDGYVVLANHAAARALGVERPEELTCQPLRSFLPSHEQECAALVQLVQHGEQLAFMREVTLVGQHDNAFLCVFSATGTTYAGKPAAQVALRAQTHNAPSATKSVHGRSYLPALPTAPALTNGNDLNDLLKIIIARAAELLGTTHGYLYLVAPDHTRLECQVGIGMFAHTVGRTLHCGEGVGGRVWKTGSPIIVDHYQSWLGRAPGYEQFQLHAVIGVPLCSAGQILGVIGLAYERPDQTFDADAQHMLCQFAELAAVALDNRRMYAASERHAQEMTLLDQARTALTNELELPVLFRTVVEAIVATFGYTQVSLYLRDGNFLVLQHQVGYDRVITHIPVTSGVSGRVALSGQAILLENVHTDADFLGAIDGIASEICVPLIDDGRVVGILNIESVSGRQLNAADLRLMLALSEHINLAIGRARLYTVVREREQQYRSVVETVSDVIFQTDTAGRWTLLNPAWTKLTGTNVETALGNSYTNYVHPDDHERSATNMRMLLTGELEVCRDEMRFGMGAATRQVRVHAHLMRDADGQVTGVAGTLTDITDLRRAEAERQAIERKMQEAQKLESLGVLAGGIAHDFNNLLMTIVGNASMAQHEMTLGANATESIAQIQLAARRATELVHQMLVYAGRGRVQIEPVNINEIIEELATLLRSSIPKHVALGMSLTKERVNVDADATQLRQVIMNLIINGSEAIGEQPGRVNVCTSVRQLDSAFLAATNLCPELPTGMYAVLEVSDTGSGMSDEILARIFDPFFTTKFTGRGLGLAAVQGIIRAHKGALWVDSAVGKGTTFHVALPCTQLPAEPAQNAEKQQPHHVRGTLLVIDDEESVLAVTARILIRYGFTVLAAPNGRDGISLFEAHRAEIIGAIVDLTMPEMCGDEVCRRLRQHRPDLPIVIVSGYHESEVCIHFADMQVAYLHKPFRPHELYDTVQNTLVAASG